MDLRDNSDLYCFCKVGPSILALLTHPPKDPDLRESLAGILQLPHHKEQEESAPPNCLTSNSQGSLSPHPEPPSAPKIYTLQEVNGDLVGNPGRVHVPFSMHNFLQAQKDLGSYSDDSEKYIDKRVTPTFDLSWKVVNIIIG